MRKDLESILDVVIERGPRVVRELHTKLVLGDAEQLCCLLAKRGISAQPYDFPGTMYVWDSENPEGIKYSHIAARQFLLAISRNTGSQPFAVSGFKRMLPHFTFRNLRAKPINNWQTTLSGLVQYYGNSPSLPILQVVNADSDFRLIKKEGLHAYDFPRSPVRTWVDAKGIPTEASREITVQRLRLSSMQNGLDYLSPEGLAQAASLLTFDSFISVPVNVWGTTPESMLSVAYSNSVHSAIVDAVLHRDEYAGVSEQVLALLPEPKPFFKIARAV